MQAGIAPVPIRPGKLPGKDFYQKRTISLGQKKSNSGKANWFFNLQLDLRPLLPLPSLTGEKSIPAQSVF